MSANLTPIQEDLLSTFVCTCSTFDDESFDSRAFLEERRWDVETAVQDYYNRNEEKKKSKKHRKRKTTATTSTLDYEQERLRAPRSFKSDKMIDIAPTDAEISARMSLDDDARHVASMNVWKCNDPNLATLFAPPSDLINSGGFETVRKLALSNHTYLLVNIQHSKEFASHMLNRDTWKEKNVHDYVKDNFIFWQTSFDSFDGSTYCALYHVYANIDNDLPHIAIIDPQTGQKMKTWKGFIDAKKMYKNLVTFLADNPFIALPTELIENDNNISSCSSNNIVETKEEEKHEKAEKVAVVVEEEEDKEKQEEDIIIPVVLDEPIKSENTLTIQLVLPDGKKTRRRFNKTQLISDVYSFAILHWYNETKKLVNREQCKLMCIPRKLLIDDNKTVQDEQLNNTTIRMDINI